jgi:hypothetical protein
MEAPGVAPAPAQAAPTSASNAAAAPAPEAVEFAPDTRSAEEQQMVDDMARDLELAYQADVKRDLLAKRGRLPEQTEAAAQGSPLRTFLREVGISPMLASDIVGEKGLRANQRLPRTFRRSGKQLDELVTLARERGLLTDADIENPNDNGGTNRLIELIQADLRGETAVSNDMADEAAQAQLARAGETELERRARAVGFDTRGLEPDRIAAAVSRIERRMERARARQEDFDAALDAQVERAALQAADDLPLDAIEALDAQLEADDNVSLQDAMRALGFTDQEIADATASRPEGAQESRSGGGARDEPAAQGPPGGAGPGEGTAAAAEGLTGVEPGLDDARSGEGADGSAGAARTDSDVRPSRAEAWPGPDAEAGLTSPTPDEVVAQQRRREEGESAEQQRRQEEARRARADAERNDFTLTGSDRPADANPRQGALIATPPQADTPTSRPSATADTDRIADLGEKIGAARKDLATKIGRQPRAKTEEERPAWARRFEVAEVVKGTHEGRWVISDLKNTDMAGRPRPVGGWEKSFATQQEAEDFIPLAALGLKHRVHSNGAGKFEIWRRVGDTKRVKVVDQEFETHDAAMEYMARNAVAILETNTTFGEADLPQPPNTKRNGAERRKGDVQGSDFMEAFGFRGVEFGNWNNQAERQQLMNDAYDGLMDLAEVLGLPPKAMGLNGDLALAFGARGHGLHSARAHYERPRAVINLTKAKGAGSLAHEWFHALDHYFGRQDGKASSTWETNPDGTRTLKTRGTLDYASHGFRSRDSGVRQQVREAYERLITTIFKKATTYVEDTVKADEFTARTRDELARELDSVRKGLSEQKDPKYWKRNNKPASAEQLAEFDAIAKRMLDGEAQALATDWRSVETAQKRIANRWTNDSLEQLGTIYKAVRGRSGFTAERSGTLDSLRNYMQRYSQRLKMLAEAQQGTEKTRMVPTEFAMDARELDQGRGEDYWTTPHEMAARAFQGYVEDKIAEQGRRSPFLNFGPENVGIVTPWGVKRPFPTGEERKAINAAIDRFVKTLETRVTDTGVAMFKRDEADAPVGRELRVTEMQRQVSQLTRDWLRKPDVHILDSMEDTADRPELAAVFREWQRQNSQGAAGGIEGFHYRGSVYLVADALATREDLQRVLYHEALGHFGLRGVFGDSLKPLLRQLAARHDLVGPKAEQYGLDLTKEEDRLAAAEEVLAEFAQTRPEIGWVRRAVAAIRTWLREHGLLSGAPSNDEIIRNYILPARGWVERGREIPGDGGSASFSRGAHQVDPATTTRAFENWFGNWQGLQAQQRLDAQDPVQIAVPKEWEALDTAAVRQRVAEVLDRMVKEQTTVQHPELGAIRVVRAGQKKTIHEGRDPAKLLIAADLARVLPASILARTEAAEGSQNVLGHATLLAKVQVGNTPLVALFTVRQTRQGQWYYNTVALVDPESQTPAEAGDGTTGRVRGSTAGAEGNPLLSEVEAFVRQPLVRVNPQAVSKVVNAAGRPLVVYHGTREDFSKFSIELAGENAGSDWGDGFYFTDKPDAAAGYADGEGGNVMPVYLNIRNPATNEVMLSPEVQDALDDGMGFTTVQEKLEGMGHDGIVFDHKGVGREFIVFRPEQIKSAIGNRGTFDPEDPDIRFSRAMGNIRERTYTPQQEQAMRRTGLLAEKVPLKQRLERLFENAGTKLAQGLVDQFAPIKDISKDAYALLRLSKGASGAFEVFLNGGQLKLSDGVYDFDEAKRGGVVQRLLLPLQGEHHDFFRWVAANRAEQLSKEDREHLFTADDIAALKTLADGDLGFDYKLQHGARAGQVTRSRAEAYRDSLRTFNEFHKNALDMAEASGLIDGAARPFWEKEFYVPFYRLDEEGVRGMNIKSGVVRQQAFRKLKGGTQQLNEDLLENTLMNWAHLLDAAAKNRAAKATLEALSASGDAVEAPEETVRQMGKSMGRSQGVVWFMDQGQKRHFLVDDPHLLAAVSGLEFAGFNSPAMKILGGLKHVLTVGVTASPFFKVRNLIRDSVQAIGTAPLSANIPMNLYQGWKATDPRSDEYFRLMAGGGTIHFGTMLEGSEAKRVQALVESGVDRATILDSGDRMRAFFRSYIEPAVTAYNELGNRGEAVNRSALYQQLRRQGINHAEASLQARDLMDFSMQGSWNTVRFLTQVVPFMNARLQGLYKLGRGAKEDPWRFSMVLGATALMSLGLMAAYHDDDDWKKREDWDRNNFWWLKFGGVAFRIPKPFEIGAIATLAERGAEWAFDDEMTARRFRENVLDLLGDNLSMNPVPQLAKPLIDLYANWDSFTDRPIESMGLEKLKSEYRFDQRTSMVARGASTAMNAVTGLVGAEALSPKQIDHLIRGYFGWLGAFLVGASDVLLRPATDQPTKPAPDYWATVTGRMVSELEGAPSRYVSQMYTQAKEVEQAYSTWRQLLREGKAEEANAFRDEYEPQLRQYQRVQQLKRLESQLNLQAKRIEGGDGTPEEKRDRILAIRRQQDQVARPLGGN